jgi:uncharacterized protein (TIGR00369 family)
LSVSIWRSQPDLDALNVAARGTLGETLGMHMTEVGADFLRGTLPVDARTLQPFGLLHGGASAALAETLGSAAANLCCALGTRAVGLELNANHLRAVRAGMVTGTARPLHLGRATQVWEIRIEDATGRLSCIARLTCAVLAERESNHGA